MLLVKTREAPGRSTELIPTLSDTEALKLTDTLCEEVVKEIELLFEVKDVIDGASVSILVTVILIDLVAKLPASSAATAVKLSIVSPKL